jgi:hypothetical protein
MTGPDTNVTAPAPADAEAHGAAEIAAFLAAEAVANDYHSDRWADEIVD